MLLTSVKGFLYKQKTYNVSFFCLKCFFRMFSNRKYRETRETTAIAKRNGGYSIANSVLLHDNGYEISNILNNNMRIAINFTRYSDRQSTGKPLTPGAKKKKKNHDKGEGADYVADFI